MILRINGYDLEIKLEENEVPILNIQNKMMFRKVIEILQMKLLGETTNEIIIDNEGNELLMQKNVLLILDIASIDLNQKIFNSAIYKELESNLNLEYEEKGKILESVVKINKILSDFTVDFDFALEYDDEVDIVALLKLFNYRIDVNEYKNILSKLYALIDLVTYFRLKQVLIFVNLALYLSSKELIEFYKYLTYKKILFLCIESTKYVRMNEEKVYLIDNELVDFMPFE